MRLTSLTFRENVGVHLDGRTHYIVQASEGWDIQVTPLGVVVTKGGKATWISPDLCVSGPVAEDTAHPAPPDAKPKRSALSQVA